MSIYRFRREDAIRFAQEQGIRWKEHGDELRLKVCPYCGKEEGFFAINLNTGAFNCMRASCGAKGNMITLHEDFGFDLGNDVREYERPRETWRRFKTPAKPIEPKPAAIAYLEGRGIPEEIARRYEITTTKGDDTVLVFPFYGEDGRLEFVKYRRTDFDPEKHKSKEWCEANTRAILFGMKQCDPATGPLVLTEGQIDSLSVAAAGIKNAVSVPNGKNGMTWIPHCWQWLQKFPEMIVFGDYERGEMTLLPEMLRRFPGRLRAVRPEDYKGCKDANDILRKYGADAVRAAVGNAKAILPEEVARLADVLDEKEPEKLSTGLREVDEALGGGLAYGYLDILTGKRGDGKSTLGSQLLMRALEDGRNAFIYSGEMRTVDVRKWLERQIVGPNNVQCKNRNGYDIISVSSYLTKYIRDRYRDQAYIYDTSRLMEKRANLLDTVETCLRQFGCRFVLIDNLMTAIDIVPGTGTKLERQEYTAKALARLAQQYDALILLVAHKRKTDPKFESDENDDVLGSSEITNLAGAVLSYERSKAVGENQRLIKVTKNRLTGRLLYKGSAVDFEPMSKRIFDLNGNALWESPLMREGEQTGFREVDGLEEEIPFD